jgi:hypothetical protein
MLPEAIHAPIREVQAHEQGRLIAGIALDENLARLETGAEIAAAGSLP